MNRQGPVRLTLDASGSAAGAGARKGENNG